MKVSRFQHKDIAVWLTKEDPSALYKYLIPSQKLFADSIKLEKKRSDFLRSRALLNYATGTMGSYNFQESQLQMHGDFYVSLSHKDPYAAASVSLVPQHLGVDIEGFKPLTSNFRNKVLSLRECQNFSETHLPTVIAFSFKESVYKALNPTYPQVKYFHQCEIASFLNNVLTAQVTLRDPTSETITQQLSISGYIWILESHSARYAVSIAYCLKNSWH
ncbi:MAG: 4'-phosphopantetheinyl transferase superfamily protein [Pseudomonadota bacterium]